MVPSGFVCSRYNRRPGIFIPLRWAWARRREAEAAAWQDEVQNLWAEPAAVKRLVGSCDIL